MDSDHSSYSSMNKYMAETDTATTEESGWTSYFEDFMAAQQKDHHHQDYNSFTDHYHHHHQQQQQQLDDQPVLSDAVSHVEWNKINQSMIGADPKFSQKLNLFKKTSRRTREVLYDDSLEDTASSPVNSPKVGSEQMGFNQIKVDDDIIENSLGKGGGFDGHLQPQKREDQSSEMVFDQENNNGNTDLRKRGLCLVPLSMFVNYI